MVTTSNNSQLKSADQHPLTQRSRFGWMPIAVIATLLINCFLTFKLLGLNKLAVTSRPYIYVQKADGTSDRAEPANKLYRSNAVVSAFAEDWLKLAYTWRSSNPNSYVNEGQVKYPLPLHMASHAIAPGYRETYLIATNHKYKDQFNFELYLSGKYQSYVRVFEQPIVRQVEPGVWDVTVIATRTHSQGNSVVAQEKFNHEFRLQAIDPGNSRLGNQHNTTLEKLFKKTQNQGLQIIKISQY
ncbi:MAG: hypothetical protein WBM86_09065 [Waterburya sp.]